MRNSIDRSNLYSANEPAAETRYFYWGYEIDTNFSEERYQEIFEQNKLDIVNGVDYIEEEIYQRVAIAGRLITKRQLSVERL